MMHGNPREIDADAWRRERDRFCTQTPDQARAEARRRTADGKAQREASDRRRAERLRVLEADSRRLATIRVRPSSASRLRATEIYANRYQDAAGGHHQ
jgi:hypothetical protein